MNKRTKIIGLVVTGALALVAVFGAFTFRSVYAQAATPTPGTSASPALPLGQGFNKGRPAGPRGEGGYTNAELAAALNITTDQLQTAYQTANAAALKEAVSKGLITQQQADQFSVDGFFPRQLGARIGIDYKALLAQALGISTDQLQAAYQQALNAHLDSEVANGNLTQAQADLIKGKNALANDAKFQAALQSAFTSAVNQAVTDGVITQAQADAILQQQAQGGPAPFGFAGPRGFSGPEFGHGFGRGRGLPLQNNNNGSGSSPTPNATPSTNGL